MEDLVIELEMMVAQHREYVGGPFHGVSVEHVLGQMDLIRDRPSVRTRQGAEAIGDLLLQ